MKKLKNNKGFTLIELLAVIVILAILVAVAVPAVTRYLNTARKGTFASNAQAAISVTRNYVISEGITTPSTINLANINELLEKDLEKSPYGNDYSANSYVYVTFPNGEAAYSICLVDETDDTTPTPVNGFSGTNGTAIAEANVIEGNVNSSVSACVIPTGTNITAITVTE